MDKITCQLTEAEIEALIMNHGRHLDDDTANRVERIAYLHRRLKSKGKAEEPKQEQSASGWGASA
jgi:hypothetical protein